MYYSEISSSSENEPNSTPKLSLSKLPSKLRELPPVMETPPLNRLVSIPFQWEEVPGKPRADLVDTTTTAAGTKSSLQNKNSVARCLELPPRLSNNTASSNKGVNASSPTTVLEGPYDSPFLSQTRSFSSLPKGSFRSLIEDEFAFRGGESCEKVSENVIGKENHHQRLKFSSWRWGSFKESRGMTADSPSFSTCSSVSLNFRHKSAAKLSRVKRRSSFLKLSHAGSNLLSGVYGSLKQVVSWRRSQE